MYKAYEVAEFYLFKLNFNAFFVQLEQFCLGSIKIRTYVKFNLIYFYLDKSITILVNLQISSKSMCFLKYNLKKVLQKYNQKMIEHTIVR